MKSGERYLHGRQTDIRLAPGRSQSLSTQPSRETLGHVLADQTGWFRCSQAIFRIGSSPRRMEPEDPCACPCTRSKPSPRSPSRAIRPRSTISLEQVQSLPEAEASAAQPQPASEPLVWRKTLLLRRWKRMGNRIEFAWRSPSPVTFAMGDDDGVRFDAKECHAF